MYRYVRYPWHQYALIEQVDPIVNVARYLLTKNWMRTRLMAYTQKLSPHGLNPTIGISTINCNCGISYVWSKHVLDCGHPSWEYMENGYMVINGKWE